MVKNEQYDDGLSVVLGQPVEEAEGVTGPGDMKPERGPNYDQEQEDRRQSELQQERDLHQERLGRPTSPGYTPATDTTPPTDEPESDQNADARESRRSRYEGDRNA